MKTTTPTATKLKIKHEQQVKTWILYCARDPTRMAFMFSSIVAVVVEYICTKIQRKTKHVNAILCVWYGIVGILYFWHTNVSDLSAHKLGLHHLMHHDYIVYLLSALKLIWPDAQFHSAAGYQIQFAKISTEIAVIKLQSFGSHICIGSSSNRGRKHCKPRFCLYEL